MFGRLRVSAESGHRCKFCRFHIHGTCGMPTDEEGYSGTLICSACSGKDTRFVLLSNADDGASMDITSNLDNVPLHNLWAGDSDKTAAKEASVPKKGKRKRLMVAQKLEIVWEGSSGKRAHQLADTYNCSREAINKIVREKETLMKLKTKPLA